MIDNVMRMRDACEFLKLDGVTYHYTMYVVKYCKNYVGTSIIHINK